MRRNAIDVRVKRRGEVAWTELDQGQDCQIQIRMASKGLPDETIGEVFIRGPNVTRGFYQDVELSRVSIDADGWLNTGDLGFMIDHELVITGRAKEIIFVNGQNYYPHDLEMVIQEALGIELGRVVACGVLDAKRQMEQLIIFVVFRGGLNEFAQQVAQIRKTINEQIGIVVHHVIPVKNIPKTTSGKLQRNALAKQYIQGEFAQQIQEIEKNKSMEHDLSIMTPPATTSLVTIQSLCEKIFPEKKIQPEDDLFEIGLSSLQLAELNEKLDELFPGKIDMTDLFDLTSLIKISNAIDTR